MNRDSDFIKAIFAGDFHRIKELRAEAVFGEILDRQRHGRRAHQLASAVTRKAEWQSLVIDIEILCAVAHKELLAKERAIAQREGLSDGLALSRSLRALDALKGVLSRVVKAGRRGVPLNSIHDYMLEPRRAMVGLALRHGWVQVRVDIRARQNQRIRLYWSEFQPKPPEKRQI